MIKVGGMMLLFSEDQLKRTNTIKKMKLEAMLKGEDTRVLLFPPSLRVLFYSPRCVLFLIAFYLVALEYVVIEFW